MHYSKIYWGYGNPKFHHHGATEITYSAAEHRAAIKRIRASGATIYRIA